MPWGVAAQAAGGLISSAMAPRVTGGGSNYYTPTGLGGADTAWQQALAPQIGTYLGTNLGQYGQQSLGQGMQALGQYGPGVQAAANSAAGTYGGLASYLNNMAQQNIGRQNELYGAGQNVYQMGLDPQQALYNRTRQQVQEQTGATNAMYGLGSSAAGAGVANQALSNFNIDWQNQQLGRALQGLQGYTGAAQTGLGYGQFGTQQAQQAPGYALLSGQLPYQVAQGLAAAPGQLAGEYGQFLNQNVYGPGQSIQNQIIPYMNYGRGAQQTPYTQQSQGAGALGSLASQALRTGAQQYFGPSAGGWGNALSSVSPGAAGWLGDTLGMSIGGTYGPATQAGLDALIGSFSGGTGSAAAGLGTAGAEAAGAGAGAAGAEGAAGGLGAAGGAALPIATALPFLLAAYGMFSGLTGRGDQGTPQTQTQEAAAAALANNPSLYLQNPGLFGTAGLPLNMTPDQAIAYQQQLRQAGGNTSGSLLSSFFGRPDN